MLIKENQNKRPHVYVQDHREHHVQEYIDWLFLAYKEHQVKSRIFAHIDGHMHYNVDDDDTPFIWVEEKRFICQEKV